MKHIALAIALVVLTTSTSFAQDTTKAEKSQGKIQEYLVSISSFAPFNVSLRYKQQLKKNTFFKIGLIDLSARNSRTEPGISSNFSTETTSFSGGVQVGLEFRKNLTDNFTLFHGPNLGFTYSTNRSRLKNPAVSTSEQKKVTHSYSASLPYSLGILFRLKGNFLIAAEISPEISYKYSKFDGGTETYAPSIGFSNNYGSVSLVYRIGI